MCSHFYLFRLSISSRILTRPRLFMTSLIWVTRQEGVKTMHRVPMCECLMERVQRRDDWDDHEGLPVRREGGLFVLRLRQISSLHGSTLLSKRWGGTPYHDRLLYIHLLQFTSKSFREIFLRLENGKQEEEERTLRRHHNLRLWFFVVVPFGSEPHTSTFGDTSVRLSFLSSLPQGHPWCVHVWSGLYG